MRRTDDGGAATLAALRRLHAVVAVAPTALVVVCAFGPAVRAVQAAAGAPPSGGTQGPLGPSRIPGRRDGASQDVRAPGARAAQGRGASLLAVP
jgi:hypothetical protein